MFRKMEPSYISGNGTLHLPAQTHKKHKKKEKSPRKNPLYFRKWNFLALILKKNFLYFIKRNPFLIFSKEMLSYNSLNGILYFSFQALKIT